MRLRPKRITVGHIIITHTLAYAMGALVVWLYYL